MTVVHSTVRTWSLICGILGVPVAAIIAWEFVKVVRQERRAERARHCELDSIIAREIRNLDADLADILRNGGER